MKNINQMKLTISKVVLVMVAIIVFWWILVLIELSDFQSIFGNFSDCIDIRRLIEVAFIILVSKLYSKSLKISLKEMFTNIDFKILALSLVGATIYLLLFQVVLNGKMCTFKFDNWIRICWCIYIGLFEEIAFRSWGYTAFYSVYDDNSKIKLFNRFEVEKRALKASIMTNIFFALIHMQTYMMFEKYTHIWEYAGSLLIVFIVGMYFTMVFHKTKSIWNVVILHAFWDWFIGIMVF